ncbi:MAG: BBP7 family outer membrane beta-barrel protein [Planctomycetota bacterium]
MTARIPIIVITVFACMLLPNVASAQAGPRYRVAPTGFAHPRGPRAAQRATCTDAGRGNTVGDRRTEQGWNGLDSCNEWVCKALFGRTHHPNCRCLLCNPRPRWASFDALMWWGKGRSVPVLASGGPDGVLPDAEILFGGGDVGTAMAAGARTDFGFWFDQCELLGMGARFWGLDGDSTSFSANTDDQPLMFRPFYEVQAPGSEEAFPVSRPGGNNPLTGTLDITTSSSVLATEAYLRTSMLAGRGYNLDLTGGYSFLRLDDDLNIHSVSTVVSGPFAGPELDVLDSFDARNEFHGGAVGLTSEIRHGCWTMTGLAKFSVGNMRQSVRIDGSTHTTTSGGSETTDPGGILAQPTNMGTYTRDKTVWIPEFGVSAAYEVREWLRLTIGYSGVWISDVVFSGDQIDRGVNSSQFSGGTLVGPARPAFELHSTEYWLHGLNLGATLTF